MEEVIANLKARFGHTNVQQPVGADTNRRQGSPINHREGIYPGACDIRDLRITKTLGKESHTSTLPWGNLNRAILNLMYDDDQVEAFSKGY